MTTSSEKDDCAAPEESASEEAAPEEGVPEGATPTVEEAVGDWSDHVAAAMQRHTERGLAARTRMTSSGYDAASMQKDMFEFGAQVWTDSLKSVMFAANIARAAASESR